MFEIWLIFRYHHAYSFGRRLFDVWTRFNCRYGWLRLHIWWWMIRCCLIFRSTIHLIPYWGIFPFQLRFINLHGVAWSSLHTRCMPSWWSIVILSWSPSGAFLGPFSQAHTFWYLDILMLLLLRDAFWYVDSFRLWIWMTRITHLMMDNLRLSDFSIYHTFDVILGHISLSIEICRSSWSHMILITHKMHVELIVYCYLIMIPQWSLS